MDMWMALGGRGFYTNNIPPPKCNDLFDINLQAKQPISHIILIIKMAGMPVIFTLSCCLEIACIMV